MVDLTTNLGEEAAVYDDIHHSLDRLLNDMAGIPNDLRSTFEEGEVAEVDSFMEGFEELNTELDNFGSSVSFLQDYMRGEDEPGTPDEIDAIEHTFRNLIETSDEFRDRCSDLAAVFSNLGLSEPSDALREMENAFAEIGPAIEESFFNNQTLLALKAHYFPETLKYNISEIIDDLDADDLSTRVNTHFIIASLANVYPAEIAKFHEEIVAELEDAPKEIKTNILATLIQLSAEESTPDDLAREQAVDLVQSSEPRIAVYAAMLLVTQATDENHVRVLADHIGELLDSADNKELKINITSVIAQLAESHPESVRHLVPRLVEDLHQQNPMVQENVIELLDHQNAAQHRDLIEEIYGETSNDRVREVAETALENIPEAASSDTKATKTTEAQTSDEILNEIEQVLDEIDR